MEWGCIGYAQSVQIHPIIKAKNQKNAQENEEARRKRKNPKWHRACTAVRDRGTAVHLPPLPMVGPTASPWWALSLPIRLLLQRCVLCSFGALVYAAGFAYVGSFWASFASFFDPHGLSRFILSSITWLITYNLQSKLKKAETSVIGEIEAWITKYNILILKNES